MINSALSSSALIGSNIDEVVDVCSKVGANGIEWTSDGFLEPGDLKQAEKVMMSTLHAGLCTVAYSSLYQTGVHDISYFKKSLETTINLNAPILHLWTNVNIDEEAFFVNAVTLGDLAASRGITLCFSYTGEFLPEICKKFGELMFNIDNPFVKIAWTPIKNAPFDESMEALEAMQGRVGLFVADADELEGFSSSCTNIGDKTEEWLQYLDAFDEQCGNPDMARYIIIRSVKGDSLDSLKLSFDAINSWSRALRRYHNRRVLH